MQKLPPIECSLPPALSYFGNTLDQYMATKPTTFTSLSTLLEKIASDETIDSAYKWLCEKRQHYHPNADIWQLRRWWHEKKPVLQAQILSGNFQFRELRLIRGEEKSIEWWSSLDALVLKAMTIVLTEHFLPVLSPRCFHLAGNGGLKGAVREVAANVEEYHECLSHGC